MTGGHAALRTKGSDSFIFSHGANIGRTVLTDTANRVLLPGLQFGRINAVLAAPGASRRHGIGMNASSLMIRTGPYQAIQLPEVAAVIADQDVTKALVSR
jgi:hypothetical protein